MDTSHGTLTSLLNDIHLLQPGRAYLAILGLVAAVLTFIYYTIRSYARLRHIPGPLTAAFTNIPRRAWVQTGNVHLIHTDLHRKHGPVVRFGPNHVLISDPGAIPVIYGHVAKFAKASNS